MDGLDHVEFRRSSPRPKASYHHEELVIRFNCFDRKSFQQNAKATYRQHYAKVKALVPKDRLLDYRLGSGWEPLCDFLGTQVPQTPFPHLNESKEFEIWMRNTQKRELEKGIREIWKAAGIPIIIFGIVFVAWSMS